jgi:hypothetical protein
VSSEELAGLLEVLAEAAVDSLRGPGMSRIGDGNETWQAYDRAWDLVDGLRAGRVSVDGG